MRDQALIPTGEVLCAISQGYAEAGDTDAATRVALGIRYDAARSKAMQSVIKALVTRGRYDAARELINRLEPSERQDAVLAAAQVAASSHHVARARELLLELTSPRSRLYALIALVRSRR